MRFNYLLGLIGDATEIDNYLVNYLVKEQALLFSVRVNFSGQGFVRFKFKADEKTYCCSSGRLNVFWWFIPPLSQGTVGRVVGEARSI